MSRRIRVIELTAEQRHLLQQGYCKGKTHAFRKRCHLVVLKNEGRSSKAIGLIVGLNELSVNTWLNRYETEGLAGLLTKPGRGRKAILNEQEHASFVCQTVKEERQRLSHAKAIVEKELNKTFSARTLKGFLKSLTAATNQ